MTEEQKQSLIGLCKIEIKRWKAASESDPNRRYMVELMGVALAALTAQPVACKKRLVNHRSGVAHHWTYHGEVDRPSSGDIFRVEVVPLYDRSAPAADLAELVPDPAQNKYWDNLGYGTRFKVRDYHNDVVAILRKIEETK